ncbi:hypothetical protein ARAM_007382 [Aspergillus rambellii]|uniref:Inner kinetochore subunit AME1 domain-containing protein n=1 Tax=Aspergillus rambellii TaxID=308745 RepID=A0A0F8WJE6_9EURO|nr:hypothetical protein ARAM_007382 [Aspergillus rambellii]
MASNRVERLQMRQRGAGTRKIKEVDFGFSLGFEPAPPQEPPVPAFQSAKREEATAPQPPAVTAPPPSETATAAPPQTQPSPLPLGGNVSSQGSIARTPGSARNKLPPRPSTFDIPADEELGLGRSSKRRKIEPPTATARPSTSARRQSQSPRNAPTGPTNSVAFPTADGIAMPIRTSTISKQEQIQTEEPPSEPPLISTTASTEQASEAVNEADQPLETENSLPPTEVNVPQANGISSPPSDVPKGKRRRRGPKGDKSPPSQSGITEDEPAGQDVPPFTEPSEVADAPPDTERPQPRREKRLRSRTPASGMPSAPSSQPHNSLMGGAIPEHSPTQSNMNRGRPTRKGKKPVRTSGSTVQGEEPAEPAPTPEAEIVPSIPSNNASAGEPTTLSEPDQLNVVETGKKRAGRPKKASSKPPPTTVQEAPRPGKRKRRHENQGATQEMEPPQKSEIEPEPEEAEPEEEPSEGERAKSAKRRRGKRPATQPDDQPSPQEATTEEAAQTKRKPRQPRGDTVPVTVHRLANVTRLGEPPEDERSAEESPDELSSRQKSRLPNRGGVNAADVLGQICRETLEKTLNTLKNGISNEANTAKRAEWTLRKKAVEAFGAELEGRLFELSEMLDSNFVLSVQLKKAKRGMMDLRSRLDQIRREREAVALKMDAVRMEHTHEEHSRMVRSTINHSLHTLDLALERGHTRPEASHDPTLTAGLEFRLRDAAQNVSSAASGAQGGLLNQIKLFNAQLEAAARRLEN